MPNARRHRNTSKCYLLRWLFRHRVLGAKGADRGVHARSAPTPIVTIDPDEMDDSTEAFPTTKKVPMVSQNDNDGTAETSGLSDNDTIGLEEEEEPESLNAQANHDNGTEEVHAIVGHVWKDGKLFPQVEFVTGETHEVEFSSLQDDEPIMCAKCILSNDVDNSCDTAALQQL